MPITLPFLGYIGLKMLERRGRERKSINGVDMKERMSARLMKSSSLRKINQSIKKKKVFIALYSDWPTGTLALKVSRLSAVTAVQGRLFHSLIVRGKNEFCLYWVRHWIRLYWSVWPLLCLLTAGVNDDLHTAAWLFVIFHNIDWRATCLLCWSDTHPRSSIIEETLDVSWYRPTTKRATLLWILSRLDIFCRVCGSHTEHAYSTIGRTNAFKHCMRLLSGVSS